MRMGKGSQLRHREKRASGDPEANLVGSPQDDKLRLDAVLQSAGNSESRRNVETKGGMLCQSVHFNRGDAAARRRTGFVRA